MYKIKILKPCEISAEEFESALNCARTCIESVLENELLFVEVTDDSITIQSDDEKGLMNMNLSEIKMKIKGCFCDAGGLVYPEFGKIIFE
jgi:DNA-binding LytR/AlgR family response regulator